MTNRFEMVIYLDDYIACVFATIVISTHIFHDKKVYVVTSNTNSP